MVIKFTTLCEYILGSSINSIPMVEKFFLTFLWWNLKKSVQFKIDWELDKIIVCKLLGVKFGNKVNKTQTVPFNDTPKRISFQEILYFKVPWLTSRWFQNMCFQVGNLIILGFVKFSEFCRDWKQSFTYTWFVFEF